MNILLGTNIVEAWYHCYHG